MTKRTILIIAALIICAPVFYGGNIFAGDLPTTKLMPAAPSNVCEGLKHRINIDKTYKGMIIKYTAGMHPSASTGLSFDPTDPDGAFPASCTFEFEKCGIGGSVTRHASAPAEVDSSTILICDAIKSAFLANKEVKVDYRTFIANAGPVHTVSIGSE